MLRVGRNAHGLAGHPGLSGAGRPRTGAAGLIAVSSEPRAGVIESFGRRLRALDVAAPAGRVAHCGGARRGVGIILDTGNAFAGPEPSGKVAPLFAGSGRVRVDRWVQRGADVAVHARVALRPAKHGAAPDLDAVTERITRHRTRSIAVAGRIGDPAAVAAMKAPVEAGVGQVDSLANGAGGDADAQGRSPTRTTRRMWQSCKCACWPGTT